MQLSKPAARAAPPAADLPTGFFPHSRDLDRQLARARPGAQLSAWGGVGYNVEVMASSDVQLMLEVKQGDEAAFELLLQRYRTPLCHFLSRMVRDPALAEDLAQEVFLRVYRARKDYQPSAKFTTWLFRIATNLALNAIRDGRFHKSEDSLDERREGEDGESVAFEVPDGHASAEQHLIEEDRAIMIRRAVLALPEKQRAAVLLHKFHEMEYEDIARILDCSLSALKSLLFRAYETLRVQLAPMAASAKAGGSKGGVGGFSS